ncbi:ABC transporter ATP-binding protein [Ilumatobacter nonamiensis]|uniref:ABC transporter ATP-binding protein n=1 Tax=Ilumatobacter nonamiensis TaxID=467093 RepID=UPI000686FD0C|nr:oligopeptide/dipeptide ABC transporter ATP-binding protein [Ilumatobacter nonamiensis]
MTQPDGPHKERSPLIELRKLRVEFHPHGRSGGALVAVNEASLVVAEGETLAVVGESGSGKSTMARAIVGTVPVAGGEIRLAGRSIAGLKGRQLLEMRRAIQMVFQDPYSSMDPTMRLAEIVGEPLRVHSRLGRKQRLSEVERLLEVVGLSAADARKYPYEFSGGQRQRIAIARAVILEPSVLICDEALSALDVTTQNQILALFVDLRERLKIAMIFIAHDLSVVRHFADRVAVMYLGRIVEHGPVERVFNAPMHPYTKALLNSVPVPHPTRQRERRQMRTTIEGELPSPMDRASGCVFRSRCPVAIEQCADGSPPDVTVEGGGAAACLLVGPHRPGSRAEDDGEL